MATSFYQVKNNAKTTITNNPLTAGGLSITLASSTGAKFPTTGNTWLGTIWNSSLYSDPSDDPNMEIVLIDSRSTDTLTVNASGRGFAGTTAVEHATGSAFRLLFTKEHADQWSTAINTLEAVSVGTLVSPTTWSVSLFKNDGTTALSGTIRYSRYMQIGKRVSFSLYVETVGDPSGLNIFINAPVVGQVDPTYAKFFGCATTNNGSAERVGNAVFAANDGTKIGLRFGLGSNWGASGNSWFGSGEYEAA